MIAVMIYVLVLITEVPQERTNSPWEYMLPRGNDGDCLLNLSLLKFDGPQRAVRHNLSVRSTDQLSNPICAHWPYGTMQRGSPRGWLHPQITRRRSGLMQSRH